MTADDIIATLGLAPHPEGGHFRQIWQAGSETGGRPIATSIYFLLRAGESIHWHRVDADELWHFHAGAPLHLRISETDRGPARRETVGPDLATGERPQRIVPAGAWQSARSAGDWSLVGCTVAPGFRFEGFELAPPKFDIPQG